MSAAITQLVTVHGMGKTPGQRLLFGGCSAGAVGAMNNLDAVAAMVPKGMQVQGLLDAASLIDIWPTGWPFSNDLIPLQTLISELVTAIGPTFAPTCAAKYTGAAQWKCLLGCVAVALHMRLFRCARLSVACMFALLAHAQAVPAADAGDAVLRQHPAA